MTSHSCVSKYIAGNRPPTVNIDGAECQNLNQVPPSEST